jgi:hypothetical protein
VASDVRQLTEMLNVVHVSFLIFCPNKKGLPCKNYSSLLILVISSSFSYFMPSFRSYTCVNEETHVYSPFNIVGAIKSRTG